MFIVLDWDGLEEAKRRDEMGDDNDDESYDIAQPRFTANLLVFAGTERKGLIKFHQPIYRVKSTSEATARSSDSRRASPSSYSSSARTPAGLLGLSFSAGNTRRASLRLVDTVAIGVRAGRWTERSGAERYMTSVTCAGGHT